MKHILQKYLNYPDAWQMGQTYHEVLENITQVIKEWIETTKELGCKIPEPKGRLIYA